MHEIIQYAEFLCGQIDWLACHRHTPRRRRQLDVVVDERWRRLSGGTADQSAQPCGELLNVARLGNVVVSPGIQAFDFFGPAPTRCQYQDGYFAPGLSPAIEHVHALHVRQSQVENDRVEGLGVAELVAGFAVRGMVDGKACSSQPLGQPLGKVGIVLDQKDADDGLPWQVRGRRVTPAQFGTKRDLRIQPAFRFGSALCQVVMG